MIYHPLTADELAALTAFAGAHGRRWKSELNNVYWYNARLWRGVDGRDDIVGSVLHGLRNTHGPSWLDGFKFLTVTA